MVKLKDVEVFFDSQQPFKPGDIVRGRVSYQVERLIKVRCIKLTLSGECKVKWKVDSGGDDEKTYKSHESYFVKNIFFHGQENAEQDVSVSPGSYNSVFQYQLPTAIPSTFSCKYGTVSYTASVSVETGGVFSLDENYDFIMNVVNPASPPAERRPVKLVGEGEDTGCFGGRESLKFEVTTDKNFYSPRESIVLNGYIMNGSTVPTEKIKLYLVQNLTVYGRRSDFSFTSSGNLKCKQKSYAIAEWQCENARPRSTVNFVNRQSITVSNIPESELRNCQNIEVKYFLQLEVFLSGWCSMTLKTNLIPVFIGNTTSSQTNITPTAPNIGTVSESQVAVTIPQDRGDVNTGNVYSAAAPHYDTLTPSVPKEPPPPSYTDAVGYGSMFSTTTNTNSAPTQSAPVDNTPAMGSYYDWSQSAFTFK